MKKIISLILIFITLVFTQCKNKDTSEKELELKKKEIELHEKELKLREDSIASIKSIDSATRTKSETPASIETDGNIENLLGYWFTPHAAMLNVRFFRDRSFVLNDFNSEGKEEKLTGTFELTGNKLTLYYSDRPKQSFTFRRGQGNDNNYYIENKGNYFVKGENGGS